MLTYNKNYHTIATTYNKQYTLPKLLPVAFLASYYTQHSASFYNVQCCSIRLVPFVYHSKPLSPMVTQRKQKRTRHVNQQNRTVGYTNVLFPHAFAYFVCAFFNQIDRLLCLTEIWFLCVLWQETGRTTSRILLFYIAIVLSQLTKLEHIVQTTVLCGIQFVLVSGL